MSMIWKSKMVLFSTLAALVIIAAEEDYETQYRRELMPRMLDTGTPRTYEQPWKTMEQRPEVPQSTPDDAWLLNSSEEPPRRRRLGRKRKRRPEPLSSEDLAPAERYRYPEEQVRPYFDVDLNSDRKMTNTPKKRRKKLEPSLERWDSPPEERPVRRRGQRRNRPSQLKTWPDFSEIAGYRPDEISRDIGEHETNPGTVLHNYRTVDDHDNLGTLSTGFEDYKQIALENSEIKPYGTQDDTLDRLGDDSKREEIKYPLTDLKDDTTQYKIMPTKINEDKSVSEFSNENVTSMMETDTNHEKRHMMTPKPKDKLQEYFKRMNKNDGPVDPLTLKEILKRSNGTSLSEILQQHNLSLTDLLHGKKEVLSILKSEDSTEATDITENKPIVEINMEEKKSVDKSTLNSGTKYSISIKEHSDTTDTIQNVAINMPTEAELDPTTTEKPQVEEGRKRPNIRKFSSAARRKLRIRPMMNTTHKSQISRDMIALNARKYFNNRRRNLTQEWKDHIPLMKKNISNNENINKKEIQTTTLAYAIEEITTQDDLENCTKVTDPEGELNNASETFDDVEIIIDQQNKTNNNKVVDIVQSAVNVTEIPIAHSSTTPVVNASSLRRQAFNNRLKKKRLKQKNLTTEPPQDDIMMNLFGIPNLVSSSEFISRTEGPKSSLDDVTILEDFITTETPHNHESRTKPIKYSSPRTPTTPQLVLMPISTVQNAKIEIEEIFNDTQTNARLSKILKERNMTLRELVEHRERGSSHVHLADIFHNASKEPNPAEPFLSKSLLEPISKETYPLRALLDANNHDTTAKATTIDPITVVVPTEVNIPMIMDFGNNVNENAENMGIISLFHNITKNNTEIMKTNLKKDSKGSLYETSITVVNTTDGQKENDTTRESRVIHVQNDYQTDIVRWNELLALMRQNYENQTKQDRRYSNGIIPAETIKKASLEEDLDDDGVIVLEDFQHLKDFDSNIASESKENIEFNTYERVEPPTTKATSILDKIPSQTKSVTMVTASIAGLAMVLFLVTYIGYKWQQQRTLAHNKSFPQEHVPTPVFENRKGHKNNSSSRSISPMLSSNIYTLNTLDSRNGKDSPDYMWDSLRKPFQ